ncbi:filamentous haemagglutinin family protein [Paraburkholderia sp. ZP32-5]|uniref:filamentous haemagglutinin family protein n=1 Tax=Paraburkholderia sp. ZP32-5 TaxID=2883245 RepID=UPI002DD441FD|nr:filamentous haemagglutinin family protein [Paraburkholderia sp. ZP32-5]
MTLRPVCHAIALMLAASAATNAHAAGLVNLANAGARVSVAGGGAAGVTNLGVGISPQQALQVSQPSIQNLARAAQGIAQQIAAQKAAAAAAASSNGSNVPNGLAAGGLQVAPGVAFDTNNLPTAATSNASSNPNLWINANGPVQTVNPNGTVNVTVKQTAQDAVVTWQTMNVGRQTTLDFDQSGGTQTNGANNWVILNRIVDPTGAPSQILGNVKADGSVYVVNRNGIVFGAGSQVNVHSLVASAMEFLNLNDDIVQTPSDVEASNQFFLSQTGGLAGLEAGQSKPIISTSVPSNEVLGLGNAVSVAAASDYVPPGNVTIEQGASITTHTNGTVSDGGLVLIAGYQVNNAGSIAATDGQVVLAAGIGVSLAPNQANPQVLMPELSGRVSAGTGALAPDITPAGTLTNTGLVQAERGTVNLLGTNVNQNGVVGVTTSVSEPGSIIISTVDEHQANTPLIVTNPTATYPQQSISDGNDTLGTPRAGQLVFGPGSVTTVLPDDDGKTATSSPGTTFTAGTVSATAGSIWMQGGSLVEAPGSTVSLVALTPGGLGAGDRTPAGDTAVQGRLYIDNGATIDVSGIANVELPISDILVTVPTISENELANSPLLRDGFLNGFKNLIFDSTLSGTNPDGSQWVGSPILNLSGYVDLIPRSIDQLLTNGGTIKLAANEVMTASGSTLNLNGGYVHYDGGIVDTTRLVDANGAIVPIGQANPYDTYVGVAGVFVDRHSRWGVTNEWYNPLLTGGVYESDFIVGGNAGTLDIFATQDMVLDGQIQAQAVGGSKQVQNNNQPIGGTFALGVNAALTLGGSTTVGGEETAIIIQNSAPSLDSLGTNFGASTPLDTDALSALPATDPDNVLENMVVPANTLSAGGFSNVSLTENKTGGKGFTVAAGTQLSVQPGGSITLTDHSGGDITILGSLIAPGGNITITGGFGSNVVLGANGVLSVAGQWVNNDTQQAPGTVTGDSEYINGGTIIVSTPDSSNTVLFAPPGTPITDTSGSIVLQTGSLIDVSGGGEIQSNGQLLMSNGVAQGKGGSLALLTYFTQLQFGDTGDGGSNLPTLEPTAGTLELNGTIRSAGFAGGGTLALQALGFQIGGDASQTPNWTVYLPDSFFAQQGFGKYELNAMYDATIAPGTQLRLTQQNLLPNGAALQGAVSGSDLFSNGLTTLGTTDAYYRQPTSLQLTAGNYLAWQPQGVGLNVTRPGYTDVTGAVTLGEGASIVADPGAHVDLGSPAQTTVLGSIYAPGGEITLTGDPLGSNLTVLGESALGGANFTSDSKSVWLGANAVLDVAGIALTNPSAAPVRTAQGMIVPDSGKVLPGGSVSLVDDSGFVVAQAGSVIDVSGASATFDMPQSSGLYAPQQVWSDAGSITLGAAGGLAFDGTLRAQPGAAQAQGGTLTLLAELNPITLALLPGGGNAIAPGTTALVLQQSGELVPAGLAPGQDFPGATTTSNGADQTSYGVMRFALDRLDGSGISTLVVNGGHSGEAPTAPVIFDGSIDLSLSRALIIDSTQIVALNDSGVQSLTNGETLAALLKGETGVSALGAPQVNLAAPYVAIDAPMGIGNQGVFTPVVAAGDGTLNVNASFVDLVNQFQLNNFAQTNLTSSGDIRMSSAIPSGEALGDGVLVTSGNLTLRAADVYPSTGSSFILAAVGPTVDGAPLPTTITFLSNGTSGVPLSAGGALLVDATNIVQSGTVRAPSGSLIFGIGDPTDPATQAQFSPLVPTSGQAPLLVATDSVVLGSNSVTSVSNDGALIPYGATIDGVEWQFNPIGGTASSVPDLAAPPAKFISVNGSHVALNAGATIDLSGGGDLQAEEWVPGTGGTRDLLSQYNIDYSKNAGGLAVPVNANGGNVYAILPGAQAPVAAYDPVFAQTVQPSTNSAGATTTTDSMGIGSAALNSAVGESVYLSGVPGLPAGNYTLLPAKYATLPGAYRVTVSSAGGTAVPGAAQTLADGTVVATGYMSNALDGSRSATPLVFDVQSAQVWQQYSQYTLTGANSFFAAQAADKGNVTPPLPRDGGQLVLAATSALSLGAALNASAAPGGAPAEVDIASQDIQIVGSGSGAEAVLPGYLQISADQLDTLGAGSLLIGGTRTPTSGGITIDAIANSIVVSNDAADPLTGPEVMLVTKTDPTGTDPNAANGLRIDPGSVIQAQGSYPAARDVPITIGQNGVAAANGAAAIAAVSGDGAFLSVSNGGDVVVTRQNTSPVASNAGLLTVGAGAVLDGGAALTLDSSGNLSFSPAASLSGNVIAVDGSAITFTNQTGAAAAALPGFVVGQTQLAQLAGAHEVILRSSGAIDFDGDVDVNFVNQVELSAGVFQGNGGSVTISAPQLTLSNDVGAPDTGGVAGGGTLTLDANVLAFGNGNATIAGFSSAALNSTGAIVASGNGTLDFGNTPVAMSAPAFIAGTGSGSTIKTTDELDLNAAQGTVPTLTSLGGAFTFLSATIHDNGATIEAPGGDVTMEASAGDVDIAAGSTIDVGGVALPVFDTAVFAPGGAISLTSDIGTVNVAAGSTLNFAGAKGGGAAGSLTLSAPDQTVELNGTISGGAASGYTGGSFSLATGGAVDLDNLATELATSGVNNAITIETRTGNLVLSSGHSINAHTVSLSADGGAGSAADTANGNVIINGTIDANGIADASGGHAGGTIDLYGRSSVDVEGTLSAEGSDAYLPNSDPSAAPVANALSTQLGGTINIGTSGTPTSGSYNAQYGYENVAYGNSGKITLGSGATIDVSGGGMATVLQDGLFGGVVNLRAPLLSDAATNGGQYVNVGLSGANIKGARAVNLEAYAVWSTTDTTTGAQHFDGIVDPAGWYQPVGPDGTAQLVKGTFTDPKGNTIDYTPGTYDASTGTWTTATLSNDPGASWAQIKSDLASDLTNDTFVPADGATNTNHQMFYGAQTVINGDGTQTVIPGTLMQFVANGVSGVAQQFAAMPAVNVVPGIELDNPDNAINNGNISIVTNWNLGSGATPGMLSYRFNGQAPIITFRAANNVEVDASVTDGFFQIANPVHPGSTTSIYVPDPTDYAFDFNLYANTPQGTYPGGTLLSYYGQNSGNSYQGEIWGPGIPTNTTDANQIAEYYALYAAYAEFLIDPYPPANGGGITNMQELATSHRLPAATGNLVAPTAPAPGLQASTPLLYLEYLNEFGAQIQAAENQAQFIGFPTPPAVQGITGSINTSGGTRGPGSNGTTIQIIVAPLTDNTPSPIVTAANPLPLQSQSLNGGNSSTFRFVAGADMNSANPLALQAASLFSASGGGDVSLDGHTDFLNSDGLIITSPTMIRTGTGSIQIAAANDVQLLDTTAPGAIYTAGIPAAGAPVGQSATLINANPSQGIAGLVVSPTVSPEAGGDISIHAQHDIVGVEQAIDADGSITGNVGTDIRQFWWQWMETGNPVDSNGNVTQASINFGGFDQGVMSVGGNVSVSAGGNIVDLAVSLPTSWYLDASNSAVTVGGGNLSVVAGGNILSGDYFVGRGNATISAGGQIAPDGSDYTTYNPNVFTVGGNHNLSLGQIATVLGAQDAVFDVSARQGVDIGAMVDPSYVTSFGQPGKPDEQAYSTRSALDIAATTGNVELGTLATSPGSLNLIGGAGDDMSYVLPASVQIAALAGGITVASGGELFPSPTGELSLIAAQSISLSSQENAFPTFGMLDLDPSLMPDAGNHITTVPSLSSTSTGNHTLTPLHADDTLPVQIYSLDGSIVDGVFEAPGQNNAGFYNHIVNVGVDKPAQIEAAQDIVNLMFNGQNLRDDDVTQILAGRDIYDTPLASSPSPVVPVLALGGPGTFDIEAGRNIGPLTNGQEGYNATGQNEFYQAGTTGIDAVGNANNPNLPHQSANVNVLFGVGPGIDLADFVATYIDPSSSVAGVPSSSAALVAFMEQYDAGHGIDDGLQSTRDAAAAKVGTLSVATAWQQFQALPAYEQRLFAEQVLFSVLTDVGNDYNDPSSPFHGQYSRGYQAINTLFPAAYGYTANDLTGGVNGGQTVTTGNLDIRSTTIQTQQGGNVTILGPGGQALVGSTVAPPELVNGVGGVVVGPGSMGILTLEKGDVDIFTDQSLLLAQSRVFTEQGGDMTIWSSNGDINAGKGSKSVADVPPLQYDCDVNHYCTVDARGEVTGAGIATLQTIPDAPPGNVNLLAPRGTVDAGAAGIRVSGNLNIAALQVLNAVNITVQGKTTGVPVVASVDTGALTAASAATSAVTQMAQNLVRNNASGIPQRHWTISVQVEGFGESVDDGERKKRKPGPVAYNPSASVAVLGFGALGDSQRAYLSKDEKNGLNDM